jgi:hypothetical protein
LESSPSLPSLATVLSSFAAHDFSNDGNDGDDVTDDGYNAGNILNENDADTDAYADAYADNAADNNADNDADDTNDTNTNSNTTNDDTMLIRMLDDALSSPPLFEEEEVGEKKKQSPTHHTKITFANAILERKTQCTPHRSSERDGIKACSRTEKSHRSSEGHQVETHRKTHQDCW